MKSYTQCLLFLVAVNDLLLCIIHKVFVIIRKQLVYLLSLHTGKNSSNLVASLIIYIILVIKQVRVSYLFMIIY